MPLIDLNGLSHFKDKENEMIAADYSASKTYAVGDYVFYNGVLYRCTTAITTVEAWTSGHWTAAKIGDDVTDLNQNVGDLSDLQTSAKSNLVAAINELYALIGGRIVPSYSNGTLTLSGFSSQPNWYNS